MKIYILWFVNNYVYDKIDMNWMSPLLHTCGCLYLLWNHSYYACYNFSLGFFVTDSFMIMRNILYKKNVQLNMGFLIHHILAISLLSIVNKHYFLKASFYKAYNQIEYSNFFLNLHPFVKMMYGKSSKVLKYYEILETIMYSYLRIIVFGATINNNIYLYPFFSKLGIMIIYCMGICWSLKLCIKLT